MQLEVDLARAIRSVALNMRERDFAEFSATSYAASREELAESLVERFADRSDVLAVGGPGAYYPIAICGLLEVRPRVLSLLFFARDEFAAHILPLTRFVVRDLFAPRIAAGVHRIECASLSSHREAHNWIETLGLSRESVIRKCGKNGEDFDFYAWTAP